jgi:hypothetical protein
LPQFCHTRQAINLIAREADKQANRTVGVITEADAIPGALL